ncbi:MFS transporter [Microbacterium sp. VKM Ac-2870]|uniref:MFS transporter n=1 Tax=Microbacterium sp. VKM Ac-2870 TaxID=2783825 RepID=UPI001E62AA5C|nr:MFS transporter [Microbacterium sp. VKM Ac-2870]
MAATVLDRTPTGSIARVAAGTPSYRRLVGLLAAGGLANFAVIYFPQPLLPAIASSFGVDAGASGLAISATTAAMLLGLLLSAPLSDRIGRVTAMGGSLVLAGILSVACGFAPTWEVFLALRAAGGIALAVLPAVALAYLRDVVRTDAHGRANALYISGTALGGAVGRLAPLPLAAIGGWQVVSVVLGALSVIIGVLVWWALPRDGAVSMPLRIGDLLGGTLASLRDPVILAVCAAGALAMATFVGLYNAVPFRLDAPPFSLGAAEVFVYFAYPLGILAPGLFHRMSRRLGRALTSGLGALATLAAIALLIVPNVVAVFAGLGLLTAAFLGTHSVLTGWVVARAQTVGRSTSRASSAYLLTYYLGSTLSGAASTHLFADAGWTAVITLATGLTAACAVLFLALSLRGSART